MANAIHAQAEGGEGEGGEKVKRIAWRKLAAIILLLAGAGLLMFTAAAIISNILAGTTSIIGIGISAASPPLIPAEARVGVMNENSIIVDNPAAQLSARFVFNFTMPFTPSAGDVEVWVDMNRNGVLEDPYEKLTNPTVSGNTLTFTSPSLSIPSGSSSWKIAVKFANVNLAGQQVSWQVYMISA